MVLEFNPLVKKGFDEVGSGGGAVDSVNSQTGVVVLDTDDIADTATNRYTNDTDITRLADTSGTNTGDQDLSNYFNKVADTSDDITEGSTNLFLTTAERSILADTSGVNTGDQDLSGYALTSSLGDLALLDTITASLVTDFDTEVSNNTDVAANTSARHVAATVLDSSTIDFGISGQQITGSVIQGALDHVNFLNIGTNTHAQIDTFIASKGANSGLATLDSGGKIPTSQLPALALTDVYTVADQTAQLALTAEEGDVAVRTDQNKSYIHNGGTAGTMADWTELLTPTDTVLSVNGMTGAVTLTTSDITEGTNLYYTNTRADARIALAVGVSVQAYSANTAFRTDKLSVFATTSSSELAGVISDETGSGALVFGTAPTFTTSITTPLIIGGTGTTDDLILRTTSGVGASGADMIFQVGNNGGTEAMRIGNSGNIGMGTAVGATARLTVATTAVLGMAVYSSNVGTSRFAGGGGIDVFNNTYTGGLSFFMGASDKGVIQAWKNATEDGNILLNPNGGYVGVGVTSPLGHLHVNGQVRAASTTATNGYMSMNAGGTTYQGYLEWYKPGTPTRVGYMGFTDSASTTDNISITLENGADFIVGGGNIGFGTPAPIRQVQIYGAGQTTSALSNSGNTGASLYIASSDGTTDSGGALLLGAQGHVLGAIKALYADGASNGRGHLAISLRASTGHTSLTEYVRILSSGYVGIGTNNPTSQLHIVTSLGYPNGLMFEGDPADLTFSMKNTSASGRDWKFISAGTGSGIPGALRIYDNTASLDRVVILNNGNMGIGTITPLGKLQTAENGGQFINRTVTGVAGTAVDIIPDGTGDVATRIVYMYIIKSSGGGCQSGTTSLANGTNIVAYNAGADQVTLYANANGSFQAQRTGGSNTYTVSVTAMWF